MNRMEAWARLLMGLVGLLGLLSLLTEGWTSFGVLISWMRAEKHEFPLLQYIMIIAGQILLVLRIVIVYQLLVRGKRWAPRLVGLVEDEPGEREGFPIARRFVWRRLLVGCFYCSGRFPSLFTSCVRCVTTSRSTSNF